ncbi:MAG TPA: hydantoinase B/oxoprolinase family protein [Conexibacter sp.]|jgi:N-methylhydantoinase B|nr:hydantoinase B/oxoprolinase family protein [Conexibacter sp.]
MSSHYDMFTTEIVRNSLDIVCQELSATVENTALSPVFTLTHDYSCGVFSAIGGEVALLARDMAVPVHIFASLESVKTMFAAFGDDIHPGDVFLVTDPYMGGTHCPDWTVIKPVILDDDTIFLPCVRGHVVDVGGPHPGNYNVDAREIWQEGFRIPPVRIVARGEVVREVWETMLANTRMPDDVRGDLLAMVGACRVGERRIRELADKYGIAALRESVSYILNYSETRLRALVRDWPDGTYEHTEYVDHDFAGNRDIPVKVSLTVAGDALSVSFDGTSDAVPGFINSPRGNTLSQVFTALTAVCPDIPVTSGFFAPVTVTLPEGSLVDAQSPSPVGNCTLSPGTTIIDATMKALEQVVPDLVGTAACDMNGADCFGLNSRTGRFWVDSDMAASVMSAGGAYGVDGWGAWAATFCALKMPSLEMAEVQFPFVTLLQEYACDTAAPGRWRGAPAVHYRRRNTDSMLCTVWNSGYRNSLVGYAGGARGAGNYWVLREGAHDELTVVDLCNGERLEPNSMLFSQSGGGGGWGGALDRDPHAVLDDWLDGLVSIEGARRDYGVVIDASTSTVDPTATAAARAG